MELYTSDIFSINILNANAMDKYDEWGVPTVIISDGPYGVNGFKGDFISTKGLAEWYEPHIAKWTEKSTPQTTLWFWGTELSWATVHPVLENYGWEYRACNIWNKGIAHIAGNTNTKSLKQFPVVTEVCVQYVKLPKFHGPQKTMTMKEWMISEWERTRLPFSLTNKIASVKNAATRKWFTKDHLWYMPSSENFIKIVNYANQYGRLEGKPYFSVDGINPITNEEWDRLRPKFYCPHGVTNVWSQPPVSGTERLKNGTKAIHLNQKPINIMKLLISASSDSGDLVWECFGGLCSGAIAAYELKRNYVAAEINEVIYDYAIRRVKSHIQQLNFDF